MNEYFIIANSFAAPFVSDTSEGYETGNNAKEALRKYVEKYTHPAGLYSARCYASADDYHKGKPFLAEYLSNHERALQKATKNKGSYSYMGNGAGDFEIDHKRIKVENPREGRIR
jgi:hypothetical protein